MKFYDEYKTSDSGAMGKAFERALRDLLGLKADKVQSANKTDMRKRYIHYEIKTGAGQLDDGTGKLLPHCSMVIYVPVVCPTLEVEAQEGFILSRDTFLSVLDDCGLIRSKVGTDGVTRTTIQTFWNATKGAPTSKKKYGELLDALYDNCDMTLEDFLDQF